MDEMRRVYQQLKEHARTGRLRRLCEERGVDLLVGFGSAIRDTGRPANDLDTIGPITFERIQKDVAIRLAAERIVTQLVELAVGVNNHVIAQTGSIILKSYRETFPKVAELGVVRGDPADEPAPSAGLRNILIHDYLKVDLKRFAD